MSLTNIWRTCRYFLIKKNNYNSSVYFIKALKEKVSISRQDHLKSKNQKDFDSRWLSSIWTKDFEKNWILNFWRTLWVKIATFVPKNRPFHCFKRIIIIIFLNPSFTDKLIMYKISLETFKRIGALFFEKSCPPTSKM